MKTPIQELINQLSDSKERLIAEKLNAEESAFDYIDAMIHNTTGIITLLRQTYLDKEKQVIQNAFLEGCDSAPDDGQPISGKTWFNETFNTKEK